jgi:methionine-rich copper-binding protein CopC
MLRRLRSTATLALAILLPIAALAHARPKVMTPAPDSTVASPAIISIIFTEAIEPKFSSLTVTDKAGTLQNKTASQPSKDDDKMLTLALPALTPGIYTVHWATAAVDGHRAQGEYNFNVK